MRRNPRLIVPVALALLNATAFGFFRPYAIEPVKTTWSGWTGAGDWVSQVITCNFDEMDNTCFVELFAGEKGQGGDYNLSVRSYPGNVEIASRAGGKYDRSHQWVLFDSLTVTYPESIVKRKRLEFRFTRSGAGRIGTGFDCGYPGITMA